MTPRRFLLRAILVAGLAAPAHAVAYYFDADVPTVLAGATFLPWDVVRNDTGTYTPAFSFPAPTPVDALHEMTGGDWLLSVGSSVVLGGTPCEPWDVVRYDGASYTIYFDGATSGIPPGSNVDAVFLDGGDLVLSFDVPTTLAGTTYEAADLVRWDGTTFSMFLDASATTPPIPPSTNVVGADQRGSKTILTFDVPTTLGSQTFIPGEVVGWDGTTFSTFFKDPAWPAGSRVNALALPAPPGGGLTIHVDPSVLLPGDLTIAWTASCSAGAEDYAIYEGLIGSWYSHRQIDCSDDGANLAEDVTPSRGNRYYLVVPLNANDEGSYGMAPDGTERPVGSPACLPSQALSPCP